MNHIKIRQEAKIEAELASDWYEFQVPGLGSKFVYELDEAILRAAENREIFELIYENVRRILMRRFPYVVYFLYSECVLEVFAILHQQRDPILWKSRSKT